jgi:hypothetical protein
MMSLYGTAIFQSAKFQLSLVCLRVFSISCLVIVISTLHRQKQQKRKIDQITDTKTISVWNAADRSGSANLWLRQLDVFANQNCIYTRCEMVDNPIERPLEHYDAIVVVFN